jgi:hypothetical protein
VDLPEGRTSREAKITTQKPVVNNTPAITMKGNGIGLKKIRVEQIIAKVKDKLEIVTANPKMKEYCGETKHDYSRTTTLFKLEPNPYLETKRVGGEDDLLMVRRGTGGEGEEDDVAGGEDEVLVVRIRCCW